LGVLAAWNASGGSRKRGAAPFPQSSSPSRTRKGPGGFFGSYVHGDVEEDIPNIGTGKDFASSTPWRGRYARHAGPGPPGSQDIRAYVELHIEQGPVLESRKIPVGVVDAIVGIRRFGVTFHGRADHAGTTPMTDRKDALLGAADLVLKGHETILAEGTRRVASRWASSSSTQGGQHRSAELPDLRASGAVG
jgi:hypothetical protein